MNSLMMALQTIALLCGPRLQVNVTRDSVKECQVQMLKCVQSKTQSQSAMNKDYEQPLAQCAQEVK